MTLTLPPWLPWLFVCAVAVGTALGMIHFAMLPGILRRDGLRVWQTQIIGTSAIWIGLTVFWVLTFGNWLAPFILAVFIAFAGLIPLSLRAIRHLVHKLDKATEATNGSDKSA